MLGAEGDGKELSVVVTDKAGNQGSANAPVIVNLDTTAPTATVASITMAAGEGAAGQLPEVTTTVNHFNAGDVVLITVPFSDVVHVTGNPKLNVTVGTVTAQATYVEGSDSNALIFKYTVVDKQLDTDGINIPANALVLNGGMINDISGNPVVLTTSAGSANANFVVDAVAPIAAVAPAGTPGATGANILANGVNAAEAAGNIVIRAPLSSSAEVGDTVELFLATGTGASASFESPLTVVVDSTAAGSGVRYVEFSVAGVDLGVDGVKLLSTKTTDVARNIGVASPALKFVLDTAAPTDPAIALTDTGVTDDFITNNKVVTVTHIAGADGGNEAATTIWEYTLDATPPGLGDVGNLASSATSNGISFGAGSEVVKGVAGTTAETQTVALSGTATAEAAVNFLGVATASVASGATATAVGNAIVAAKAAIIAGAAGQAAGIADISNNAGTLTITYKATASWVRGTSSGTVSLPDATYATGDFAVRRTDAAGNVSTVVSNAEGWTIDTVKPTFTTAAAIINNAGHATVLTTSEVGNAYLVNTTSIASLGTVTEAGIKNIGAADTAHDELWNTVAITATTSATDVPATGLAAGTYKLYVADVAGNLSSASTATITVDVALPTASAFGVASATTLRGTSTEAGSLVLVKAADGLVLTNAVTAGAFTGSALTKTVTVVAQDAVTAATLKVLDAAGNVASTTLDVILGSTGHDTLTLASGNAVFSFAGNDTLTFGSTAPASPYIIADYSATDLLSINGFLGLVDGAANGTTDEVQTAFTAKIAESTYGTGTSAGSDVTIAGKIITLSVTDITATSTIATDLADDIVQAGAGTNDLILAASSKAILVVGEANGTDGVNVYYATTAATGVEETITLVGTLNGIALDAISSTSFM